MSNSANSGEISHPFNHLTEWSTRSGQELMGLATPENIASLHSVAAMLIFPGEQAKLVTRSTFPDCVREMRKRYVSDLRIRIGSDNV